MHCPRRWQCPAGHSASAAGNSTAKHAPRVLLSARKRKIPSRHHIQLEVCSWTASEDVWLLTSVTLSPRRGWTTSLFQHWTSSLDCFPLSPRAAIRQTYTRVWNIFPCAFLLPSPQNSTPAWLRDHPEAASAEGRVRVHPEESQAGRHHGCTEPGHHLTSFCWRPQSFIKLIKVLLSLDAYRSCAFLEQATKCLLAFMLTIISSSLRFWAHQVNAPCSDLGSFPFCSSGINAGYSASFR